MQSGLAKDSLNTQDVVLILGRDFVPDQLADQLRFEGFDVVLERDVGILLDTPEKQTSVSSLKRFLDHFISRVRTSATQLWIHPGTSAWSERQELHLIAKEKGLNVFGPSPKVVSLFSNRLNFLSLATELSIPNLVVSFDPITSARELRELVNSVQEEKNYCPLPIVMKSIRGGGGGPGFLVIHELEQIESRLDLWSKQVNKNVGESLFFTEKYLEDSRRVLVPFVRFSGGETRIFPKVDCSLQYRHREILAFCPIKSIDVEMEQKLDEWTKTLASECQYVGLGVLEFLVDGTRAFLIDGKPGLNSNYTLWESTSSNSVVSWQLASSFNEECPFPEMDKGLPGVTISAQIFAENPFLEIPQPGLVHSLDVPQSYVGMNEWAKVDARFKPGEKVDLDSNGLLAHITAHSINHENTVELLSQTLRKLWVSGTLQTNERFVQELIEHPWVREGIFHSSFVEEEFIPLWDPPKEVLESFGWVCSQVGRFLGRPNEKGIFQVGTQKVQSFQAPMNWVEQPEIWKKGALGGVNGTISIGDDEFRVGVYPLGTGNWQVRVGDWWSVVREVHEESSADHEILSQTNGRIHSRLYREGSVVKAHEPILLVYSLRTLVPHALPIDVKIKKWHVQPGSDVHIGQKLLEWVEVDS